MKEFSAWIQSNWYTLGNLLSQLAFLAAGIWFARKILKTIRATQEQFGALLKLSVAGTIAEPQSPQSAEQTPLRESPYWLTPGETAPALTAQLTESGPNHLALAWHGTIRWLQAPMSTGQPAAWRRVVRWLQAPVRS